MFWFGVICYWLIGIFVKCIWWRHSGRDLMVKNILRFAIFDWVMWPGFAIDLACRATPPDGPKFLSKVIWKAKL